MFRWLIIQTMNGTFTMKLNDFVSYPGHGVGRIIELKLMHDMTFFSIQILDSGLKIMIPETSQGLVRHLMSVTEAKLCALYIREPSEYMPEKTPSHMHWKYRHNLYLTKINSNNPIKIAEV